MIFFINEYIIRTLYLTAISSTTQKITNSHLSRYEKIQSLYKKQEYKVLKAKMRAVLTFFTNPRLRYTQQLGLRDGYPLAALTMEMRPSYRWSDEDTLSSVYLRTRSGDPSLADDSGICVDEQSIPSEHHVQQQEIHNVLDDGVRYELRQPARPTYRIVSKDELMDSDTAALWSTSLFDGDDSSAMRDDITEPTRGGGSSTVTEREPPLIQRSNLSPIMKCKTFDAPTVASTLVSVDDDDNSSQFSSSCLTMPVFHDMAAEWRDQGIFCFGKEITDASSEMVALYANRSNMLVETAATELLHESVLKGADDFFSDDQARSFQATFSEVSEEFDIAGNKVIDLTSMINVSNHCTCSKTEEVVDKEVLHVVKQPELVTIPSEVAFKVRVSSSLKTKQSRKSKRKKDVQKEKENRNKGIEEARNKGMFRKIKGRFRRSNR